eukprot:scaffold42129_cov56-Phaeocystis_antarctica.AAC.2
MSEAEEVERLKKDLDKCNSIIKVSAGAVVSTHDTPRSDEPGARIEAGQRGGAGPDRLHQDKAGPVPPGAPAGGEPVDRRQQKRSMGRRGWHSRAVQRGPESPPTRPLVRTVSCPW